MNFAKTQPLPTDKSTRMIDADNTIRFSPADVPDLPELRTQKKRKQRKRETPEPSGWRPFGEEW